MAVQIIRPNGVKTWGADNAWEPSVAHAALNTMVSDNSDRTWVNAPYTRAWTLQPNGNAAGTKFVTPFASPTVWQALNGAAGDKSYVRMTNVAAAAVVQIANMPALLPEETITSVQAVITFSGQGKNLGMIVNASGVRQFFDFWAITSNYPNVVTLASPLHTRQPNNAVWTVAALNGLTLEVDCDSNIPIYRAWIQVNTSRPLPMDLLLGDVSLPAGAHKITVQPVVRVYQNTVASEGVTVQLQDATNHQVRGNWRFGAGRGTATHSGPAFATYPNNVLWTQATVNNLVFHIACDAGNATFRVFDAYVNVSYNLVANPPTGLSPSGTITNQLPTLAWNYSDPENNPQQAARVILFTDLQHSVVGFNPDTSPAFWRSGNVNTAKHSVVVPVTLPGNIYWFYVAVSDDAINFSPYGAPGSFTVAAPVRTKYVTSASPSTTIPEVGLPITKTPVNASLILNDTNFDRFIYIVPQGVTRLMIDAWGGCGAAGSDGITAGNNHKSNNKGGPGGYVGRLLINVTPGERIWVSFNSIMAGAGGWYGSIAYGGNGGPAVDIRRGSFALANRLVVAGGGGGAGSLGQVSSATITTNWGGIGGMGGTSQSTGGNGLTGVSGAIGGHGAVGQASGLPGDLSPYMHTLMTKDTWANPGTAPYFLPPSPQSNQFEEIEHAGDGGKPGVGDTAAVQPVYGVSYAGGGGGGGGAGYPCGAGGGAGAQDASRAAVIYGSGGGGGSGGDSWVSPALVDYVMRPGLSQVNNGAFPAYTDNRGSVLITPNPIIVEMTSPGDGSQVDVSGAITFTWALQYTSTHRFGQASYSIRRRSLMSTMYEYWTGITWGQSEGDWDYNNNNWVASSETFLSSSVPQVTIDGWLAGATWAISVAVIDTSGAYSQYSDEITVEMQVQPAAHITMPVLDATNIYYSQLLMVAWAPTVYSSSGVGIQRAYQVCIYTAGLPLIPGFVPGVTPADIYDSGVVFTDDTTLDVPVILEDATSYVLYVNIAQNNMQWGTWSIRPFATAAGAWSTAAVPTVTVGLDDVDDFGTPAYLTDPANLANYNGTYGGSVPSMVISLSVGSNNLLFPQVSFMADGTTLGWNPNDTNTNISNSANADAVGGQCLQLQAIAAGDISAISTVPDYLSPVTPGDAYDIAATFLANTTGRSVTLGYSWYDNTQTLMTSATISGVADNNATWTNLLQSNVVAPDGAAFIGGMIPYVIGAAAGEIHYVDAVTVVATGVSSIDPDPSDYFVGNVQRSVDLFNWQEVRLSSRNPATPVYDFEFPVGATVFYRARMALAVTNPDGVPPVNGVAFSDWSDPVSVTVPQGNYFWLSDPLTSGSATPVVIQTGGNVPSTPERQQVFQVLGSSAPVIVADVVGYDTLSLQIDLLSPQMVASFLALLGTQRVLCLQGNNGNPYVRLGGSFSKPYTSNQTRTASGNAMVVDPPAIPQYVPVVILGNTAIEMDSGNAH